MNLSYSYYNNSSGFAPDTDDLYSLALGLNEQIASNNEQIFYNTQGELIRPDGVVSKGELIRPDGVVSKGELIRPSGHVSKGELARPDGVVSKCKLINQPKENFREKNRVDEETQPRERRRLRIRDPLTHIIYDKLDMDDIEDLSSRLNKHRTNHQKNQYINYIQPGPIFSICLKDIVMGILVGIIILLLVDILLNSGHKTYRY